MINRLFGLYVEAWCHVCKNPLNALDLTGFKFPGVEIPEKFLMEYWSDGEKAYCSEACAKRAQN